VLIEVRNWSDPPARRGFKPLLQNISFCARQGEVVGFAGLAGAGRTELALSLFGARPRGSGEFHLAGNRIRLDSPADALRAGLGYLSEDRKNSGLFLDMSIARNIASAQVAGSAELFLWAQRERTQADQFRERLRITSRSANQEVGRLSGGNQQKVFLARWLLVNPRVLIVDEPTRGVDVGAKAAIHRLLYEFASRGAAVIVISSDLPEVLTVSDRILVMREGRIAGELNRQEASEEAVMRLAAGSDVGGAARN
jgi:ABC-type sugar transport system ATPase subunit